MLWCFQTSFHSSVLYAVYLCALVFHSFTVCQNLILVFVCVCLFVCDWFTIFDVVNVCFWPFYPVSFEPSLLLTCLTGTLLSSDNWLPVNHSHINYLQNTVLQFQLAFPFPLIKERSRRSFVKISFFFSQLHRFYKEKTILGCRRILMDFFHDLFLALFS